MARHEGNGQQFLFECEETAKRSEASPRRRRSTGHATAMDAPTASALTEQLAAVLDRLAHVESLLTELRAAQATSQLVKEFYTTAEAAKILGRRPYTVREWCRLGRVNGEKTHSGRGQDEEWRISHDELLRIQNEGLLPMVNSSALPLPGRLPR